METDEKKARPAGSVQYQQTLHMKIADVTPCLIKNGFINDEGEKEEEGEEYTLTNWDEMVMDFIDALILRGDEPLSTIFLTSGENLICIVQYVSKAIINQMELAKGARLIEIPVPGKN